MSRIILKPGKEKSLLRRHPWIFSGAIDTTPVFENGDILPVYSSSNELLAHAYFHTSNSIAGRILSFGMEDPVKTVRCKIQEAIALRQSLKIASSAYRIINAEGDGLPGLIVDSYGPVLSIQITTAGMEKLKPIVLETLVESLHPISIYEKSSSAARQMEGLSESIGLLYGNLIDHVEIEENGMRFTVSIVNGQKTGFFLDQREMRSQIAKIAKGKRVLNCFSYTGSFSLAALKGGALHVDSVDISKEACQLCDVNCQEFANHTSIQADVFNFLNQSALNYDLVILDPPAFAKKRSDLINACKGYKEINRKVIEKVPSSCILVTSSCSSYMDDSLFQNVLSQAASEANRFVRRIGSHIQAPDHPVSLFHPEGHYLKSQILIIY